MTDEELLAEIAADHGDDCAAFVAEILAGSRGEPVEKRHTRAGPKAAATRAGVPEPKMPPIVPPGGGGTGKRLPTDPGFVVSTGEGRAPTG